jgi:pectin methylesterase-like acyl-CoA thioesterase
MGRIGKTLTLLLAVLFISSLVMAQPIFVKAQSKTIIVPDDFATIQSAINHATNGGTVYVRSGIYTENELSITKSISLIGENVETTKIKLNSEKHDEPLYQNFQTYTEQFGMTELWLFTLIICTFWSHNFNYRR